LYVTDYYYYYYYHYYCYYYYYHQFGIATGYGLDGRGSIPGEARDFSLLHSIQTGSGTHLASHSMGTAGSFPGG
jgi:hypothetical protein